MDWLVWLVAIHHMTNSKNRDMDQRVTKRVRHTYDRLAVPMLYLSHLSHLRLPPGPEPLGLAQLRGSLRGFCEKWKMVDVTNVGMTKVI